MAPGRPILEVKDLSVHDGRGAERVRTLSLTVRAGEIVTIAGVEGNGQSELIEAISGLRKPTRGAIVVNGNNISSWSVRQRRDLVMAHVPEDRVKSGVAIAASITMNAVLGRHHRSPVSKRGWIDYRRAAGTAAALIDRYRVKAAGTRAPAGSMSGGNLQKFIVGRELSCDVPLMVVAQPTRGVDVGSLEFIHEELLRQRDGGRGILVVSTDLDEVFLISDRILVMYDGQIVGEFRPESSSREETGMYMTGIKSMLSAS
jgi:simple sugar transport system ATP-binding protein